MLRFPYSCISTPVASVESPEGAACPEMASRVATVVARADVDALTGDAMPAVAPVVRAVPRRVGRPVEPRTAPLAARREAGRSSVIALSVASVPQPQPRVAVSVPVVEATIAVPDVRVLRVAAVVTAVSVISAGPGATAIVVTRSNAVRPSSATTVRRFPNPSLARSWTGRSLRR